MTTRWIIAATAAVGVGALTTSMLMGPSHTVALDTEKSVDPGKSGERRSPACKAESQANLDFTVKDMHGTSVRLADHKGKVVLINFWATWCAPCKAEIPAFVDLYAKYKDQGLVILGISADDDAETLRSFAAEWKLNYPVLVGRDEDKLLDAYGPLFGYPTSVIIGRDGAVCGRHVGPATKEEFEGEIKALL
jgi:peroxiredoxin